VTTLLVDAKDLISLIEHDTPMSSNDFIRWSNDRDLKLVLSFTNVSEFSEPLRRTDDLLYMRSILQKVGALPVMCLRESLIEVSELENAIIAFNAGADPKRHDPFVSRWDETFANRGEKAPAEMIVNYRLDLMVFDLLGPDARRTTRKLEVLSAIRSDRAIPKAERLSPRRSLTAALERMVNYWQLSQPNAGFEAFGKWIYSEPARCPGSRLAWEVFHALVANKSDALEESDLSDNAHIPAIPYVDYATLDRRMTGYCKVVSKRLGKVNPDCDYVNGSFEVLPSL
jgi:hypothetical protein